MKTACVFVCLCVAAFNCYSAESADRVGVSNGTVTHVKSKDSAGEIACGEHGRCPPGLPAASESKKESTNKQDTASKTSDRWEYTRKVSSPGTKWERVEGILLRNGLPVLGRLVVAQQ